MKPSQIHYLCTMDQDNPIVAEIDEQTIVLAETVAVYKSASQAADEARGSNEPPESAHTYGQG